MSKQAVRQNQRPQSVDDDDLVLDAPAPTFRVVDDLQSVGINVSDINKLKEG